MKGIRIASSFQSFSSTRRASLSQHVYSKGCGLFGALGQGSELLDSENFKKVEIDDEASRVSSGWGHSGIVAASGKLIVTGRPYDFPSVLRINRFRGLSPFLARSIAKISGKDTHSGVYDTPIVMPIAEAIEDVKCSAGLTIALSKEGTVYAFGANRWLQCGQMGKATDLYQPSRVGLHEKVKSIDCGLQHVLAMTRSNRVFVWGKGDHGQLGDGEKAEMSMPRLLDIDFKVISVCAGFSYSAILAASGEVYVFGKGMSDRMKTGQQVAKVAEDELTPRKLEIPLGRKVKAICSSNFTLVMLAEDNSLWAIGMGEYDRNAITNPIPIQSPEHPEALPPSSGEPPKAVLLPDTASLRKGYQRVSVLVPRSDLSPDFGYFGERKDARITTDVFEVVLHEGEAFLQPLDIAIDSLDANSVEIADISTGWMHTMVVLKHS